MHIPQRESQSPPRVRGAEAGSRKIVFDDSRTLAIACSGGEMGYSFAEPLMSEIARIWQNGQSSRDVESFLHQQWELIADKVEVTLILAGSNREDILKVVLKESGEVRRSAFGRDLLGRIWLIAGDVFNPAGMLLDRYLPKERVPVGKLKLLAAHYILTGNDLNTSAVEGLAICIAKDGQPFSWVSDSGLASLKRKSQELHIYTRERLFEG